MFLQLCEDFVATVWLYFLCSFSSLVIKFQ
jgi:hypothetical protein